MDSVYQALSLSIQSGPGNGANMIYIVWCMVHYILMCGEEVTICINMDPHMDPHMDG